MVHERRLRILLIDDDNDLLDLLKYNFQKEGFKVKTVSEARKAVSSALAFLPELIVLDVAMPDGNGIDLCREIRGIDVLRNTSIFFLSARPAHSWMEDALDTGGDDFIEKLSGLRALTNRVNAVLRDNFVIKKGIPELAADPLVIDKKARTVYLKEREMALSAPEFDILFFLMQNPDKEISSRNLIEIIWGSEMFALDSSVKNYVESLQRKLGKELIQTVNNGCYRFVRKGN